MHVITLVSFPCCQVGEPILGITNRGQAGYLRSLSLEHECFSDRWRRLYRVPRSPVVGREWHQSCGGRQSLNRLRFKGFRPSDGQNRALGPVRTQGTRGPNNFAPGRFRYSSGCPKASRRISFETGGIFPQKYRRSSQSAFSHAKHRGKKNWSSPPVPQATGCPMSI
jgi:hypothetical protein